METNEKRLLELVERLNKQLDSAAGSESVRLYYELLVAIEYLDMVAGDKLGTSAMAEARRVETEKDFWASSQTEQPSIYVGLWSADTLTIPASAQDTEYVKNWLNETLPALIADYAEDSQIPFQLGKPVLVYKNIERIYELAVDKNVFVLDVDVSGMVWKYNFDSDKIESGSQVLESVLSFKLLAKSSSLLEVRMVCRAGAMLQQYEAIIDALTTNWGATRLHPGRVGFIDTSFVGTAKATVSANETSRLTEHDESEDTTSRRKRLEAKVQASLERHLINQQFSEASMRKFVVNASLDVFLPLLKDIAEPLSYVSYPTDKGFLTVSGWQGNPIRDLGKGVLQIEGYYWLAASDGSPIGIISEKGGG